jgi:hypothetical protein
MVQLQDDGNFVIYESPNGPLAGRPIWASSTGAFVVGDVEPEPTPPPGQATNRPLIGPLKIVEKLFRDDTGHRRVQFASWFPALRILRDTPAEFTRQLNAIAAANWQGFRTFLAVGGWTPGWDGREVVPVGFRKWKWTGNFLRTDQFGAYLDAWPDYDDLLRALLRACKARKLRLHVACGDCQIIFGNDQIAELDFHRRAARICAEEGGTDVVALSADTNEYPLNRYGGGSDLSIEQMGRIIRVWEDAIPGVLTCEGAVCSEEPDDLAKSSRYGDVCDVHVTRSPFSMCLKRTFGLVYWEGNYRGFPKPFWEGEPAGPGEHSYQRQDDPANLTALYAMHALTGQASNYFNGPAVLSQVPLESTWGFTELPALFAQHLPEDVATWDHGSDQRGGIEYWWKGNTFATATCVEWSNAPPRPIAQWTCYPSGQSGTGTPPAMTGLLVGTFQ